MASTGRCAFFRLMLKRVIAERLAHKPPTKTKYILDLNTVKIRLFDETVPKTCHNFAELCTHNQGFGYTGSVLSNIVQGFGIFGGDVVKREQSLQPHDESSVGLEWDGMTEITSHGKPQYLPMPRPTDGLCGRSVYGNHMREMVYEDETFFEDENFQIKHNKPGIITMANHGPNTNTSKFVILTAPASYLDGKNVAFGEVIEGLDTLLEVEEMLGSECGVPRHLVEIVQSGILEHEDDTLPERITLQDMNAPHIVDKEAWRTQPIYLE